MLRSFPRSKVTRKSIRRPVTEQAYVRLDGGFAVRPCVVLDRSETGIKIAIAAAKSVPDVFTFLASRNSPGRRATVKWRETSQLGAEFL